MNINSERVYFFILQRSIVDLGFSVIIFLGHAAAKEDMMVLGISKRDRHAVRSDKVWKSRYHRQLLELNRGLTNSKVDVPIINQFKQKPITDFPRSINGGQDEY